MNPGFRFSGNLVLYVMASIAEDMSGQGSESDNCWPPEILATATESECSLHREFLFRHVDFLVDTLTGEQWTKQWTPPAGCPSSSPERLARRRGTDEKSTCRYQDLTRVSRGEAAEPAGCACGDPLVSSTDPLDTVAAVAIAPRERTPGERYFDHEYRRLVADLREVTGSWAEIESLARAELSDRLAGLTERPGVDEQRVARLHQLLAAVADYEKTDGVTLQGMPSLQYEKLAEDLAGFPGVSASDAWWLLLVAFDKPVWPADPQIDRFLCSLGFIAASEVGMDALRRQELEDKLTDRQIPALHRAVAGHAVKGSTDACGDNCPTRKFMLTHRLRKQSQSGDSPAVVDLFSGAGGISLGFDRAGCTIKWAIDNDRDAVDTYRLNHPEIPHENVVCNDIQEEIAAGTIEDLARSPDILVGGPPCQSLSQAGYRSRRASDDEYSVLDDERTSLYQQYVEFAEALRPKALVMENVEGMMNEVEDTEVRVGDRVIRSIEDIGGPDTGYVCDYELLDCSELGIPQKRERVIIIGLREDLVDDATDVDGVFDRIRTIATEREYTLQQALSGLPKIRRGEGGRVVAGTPPGRRSEFVRRNNLASTSGLCFNHRAREHPMEKDQRLFDEAMEPGDTGWDVKYGKDGKYADLIEYDVGTRENPRFKDKYRMLEWDQPAPTIVAHLAKDANSFILPDYYEHATGVSGSCDNRRNRGITPREAARIQSFPDSYVFMGAFTSWFRQIGNAIPPLLGEHIASAVTEYLSDVTAISPEPTHRARDHASTDD